MRRSCPRMRCYFGLISMLTSTPTSSCLSRNGHLAGHASSETMTTLKTIRDLERKISPEINAGAKRSHRSRAQFRSACGIRASGATNIVRKNKTFLALARRARASVPRLCIFPINGRGPSGRDELSRVCGSVALKLSCFRTTAGRR